MIRKDKKTYADGTIKTQIRVVEGYRPGPGLAPKQRTIKNFGYLEDQEDQEAFLEMVKRYDNEQRKETVIRIEVPATAKMYSETNRRQNYQKSIGLIQSYKWGCLLMEKGCLYVCHCFLEIQVTA
jgi:hypothetical protein